MRVTLLMHIAAGLVGIVSGYAALYAAKGAALHRRSGIVFVWSMMTMALFAVWMAAGKGQVGNVIAGSLTAYLVATALTTVRPPTEVTRRVERGGMLVAVGTGAMGLALALPPMLRGDGARDGVPAAVYLVFGIVALLSALGDARMMRAGGIRGPRRLARHLWRMCAAHFIAAGSFFLGQADEFPERLRVVPVLMALALTPLAAMLYWLWRVRVRRTFQGGPRRRPAEGMVTVPVAAPGFRLFAAADVREPA